MVGDDAGRPLAAAALERDKCLLEGGAQDWRDVGELLLLRVAVADMSAFDQFYKRLTDAVPIKNVTSHFAMERMKFTTAYPVDTLSR